MNQGVVILIGFLFFWVVQAGVGGLVCHLVKGQFLRGFGYGMLLGPFGWVITLLFAEDARFRCHYCNNLIDPEARICPICHAPVIQR